MFSGRAPRSEDVPALSFTAARSARAGAAWGRLRGKGNLMQVFGVGGFPLFQLGSSMSIKAPTADLSGFASKSTRSSLQDLTGQVLGLRRALGDLQLSTRIRFAAGADGLAQATSSSALGLSLQEGFTTLRSTEEVNATPTSFTPFQPSVSGSSTFEPTVGGVYDGDQGDDTLIFSVREGFQGEIGRDFVVFRVGDSSGEFIQNVILQPSYQPDTAVTLSNGLTVSFSEGVASAPGEFTVDVSASIGSAVNPDNPLDGVGANDPNLQFGQQVNPGAFWINGVTIEIASGDSLNDVLAKITSSEAGVAAAFDGASETVVLTQKTAGAGAEINLQSDNTGFFEAIKFAGATPTPGSLSDLDTPIAEVPELAGIQSGQFGINGATLTVDVMIESLRDVVDKINASEAGVVASFDEEENAFQITAKTAGADVELDDGTSGFFSGLKVDTGLFAAEEGGTVFELKDATKLRSSFEDFAGELESLFTSSFDFAASFQAKSAVNDISDAIRESFEPLLENTDKDVLRSGFGIDFDFSAEDGDVLQIDEDRLRHALRFKGEELAEFLAGERGPGGSPGLVERLAQALDDVAQRLVGSLDDSQSIGLMIDLAG